MKIRLKKKCHFLDSPIDHSVPRFVFRREFQACCLPFFLFSFVACPRLFGLIFVECSPAHVSGHTGLEVLDLP